MNVLKRLYDWLDKVFSVLITALMVIIVILVSSQIVFRYFLHKSMGGFEELPVFLLIAMVWLGGILVAKHDDHVRIDLVTTMIKNESRRAILTALTSLITALCSGGYTVLCWTFVTNAIKYGTASPALRFPMWYIYAVTLVASAFNTFFFILNMIVSY